MLWRPQYLRFSSRTSLLQFARRQPSFYHSSSTNSSNSSSISRIISRSSRGNRNTRTTLNSAMANGLNFDNVKSDLHQVELTEQEDKICKLLVRYTEHFNAEQQKKADDATIPVEPMEVRITGGWVRDKLLGRPCHDLDVAINCNSGGAFAEGLNNYIADHTDELGLEPKSIHKIERNPEKSKNLETATTKLYDLEVDFVTLRKDDKLAREEFTPLDQTRKPEHANDTDAVLAKAREDAYLRDATLNAIFYNLNKQVVEDFTGRGIQDLQDGRLRTPLQPIQTFTEDPLRVIRFLRFASTFGFAIGQEELEAMRDPVVRQGLQGKISKERVGMEVVKALTSTRPHVFVDYLDQANLFDTVCHLQPNEVVDSTNPVPPPNLRQSLNVVHFLLTQPRAAFLIDKLKSSPNSPKTHQFQFYFWLAVLLNPWEGFALKDLPESATHRIVQRVIKLSANDGRTVSKMHFTRIQDLSEPPFTAMATQAETTLDASSSPVSRKEMGLFIRKCGAQWDLVLLYGLFKDLLDIVLAAEAAGAGGQDPIAAATAGNSPEFDAVFSKYESIVAQVQTQNLANAWQLKPLLNGREMSTLYDAKGGQWMSGLIKHIIEYQLENPEATKDQASEYLLTVKDRFL